MSYTDADRVKWEKVLVTELISTDESETEDGEAVLVVKKLTWRSDRVSKFFATLDSAHKSHMSEQASRQTKRRIEKGRTSIRPAPSHVPSWAIRTSK